MPIVNGDVKSLEIVVAAELSGDSVMGEEIRSAADMHTMNQIALGLPSRAVAKIFVFRLLYGGSAYAYALDPDFDTVSSSVKFWERVIDKFYSKYTGIYKWHKKIINEAKENGYIEIPSGRIYPIKPDLSRGYPKWPETVIKNYPVQGFGADLVKLARIEFCRRLKADGTRADFISTIHDSLVADCPEESVRAVARALFDSIAKVPVLCRETYDYEFKLPMTSEIQVGPNKRDLVQILDF